MAKRGQTYPYRVRYEWTSGLHGVIVASSLDDANMKADQLEGNGIRHPEHDITVTIVRKTDKGEVVVGSLTTSEREIFG